MSNTEQNITHHTGLSPKWQERFAFFDQYGAPTTSAHKEAFKALPANKKRLIQKNFIAFCFGPIYLFVLGLWRKNISFIVLMNVIDFAIGLAFAMADKEVPHGVNIGIGVGFAFTYMTITNYAYYLKQVKGSKSWNPFEGLPLLW